MFGRFARKRLLVSTAEVATETPERYAKQLAAHLGHHVPVEETAEGRVLTFGNGRGTLQVGDGVLRLRAEGRGPAALAEVQDVLARHLVKFGQRQDLSVTWSPAVPA